MRTVVVETVLDTPADRHWAALQHPASLTYVMGPLLTMPVLGGRTDPVVEGEEVSGRLFLGGIVPLYRHTIAIVGVDQGTRTIRTREHGGVLRTWNHTLHTEEVDAGHCRYSDTVELDAGRFTGAVARFAEAFYRYRHRRWRGLVARHLSGPATAVGQPVETAAASR